MQSHLFATPSSFVFILGRLGLVVTLLIAAVGVMPVPLAYASDGAGSGLDFDGVNDHVVITNESNFDFTDQMTVESWIKVDQFDRRWQAIVTKGDTSWRVHRYSTSDNVAFGTNGISSSPDLQGSSNVNDGNWHHIAAVYRGSMKYLYVDGVLDGEQPASGNLENNDYAVYIGENAQETGRYFDGQIDEVRVWNAARTQTEIQDNMHRTLTGSESNLVAYWRLNESSGTTADDLTSNDNDGTLTNMDPNTAWISSTCPVGDVTVAGQQDIAAVWAANILASSSGLIISNSSFLNDVGDDIVFGHDGGTGTTTSDLPRGVSSRWSRVWYQDITDVGSNGGNVQLAFDFSESGLGVAPSGTYALLERDGTSDDFSVVTTTTTLSGDQVIFNIDVSELEDGWYYTLGEAAPDLTLAKTVDDDTPNPGQLISYRITINNNGLISATNALISDTLPIGFTFAGPVTLDGTSGTVAQDETDLPTLAHSLTITNGTSITVTFPVTVNTGLAGGTVISNIAAVTSTEVIVPQMSLSVGATVQNVAPVAVDDDYGTSEDVPLMVAAPGVMSNDSDSNGDALTTVLDEGPTNGTLTLNADGSFIYTPTLNFDGTDTFAYVVDDGFLTSAATVTVNVSMVNDAPTFTSTPVTAASADSAYTYNVTATDVDAVDALVISAPTLPGWLSLTDYGDGTATLSGTPANADIGDHGVMLEVTDGVEIASQSFTIAVSEKATHYVYLPLIVSNYVAAPDLIVESITATSNNVQVVVKNVGHAPVADEFWVDGYINPNPVPTGVNQTWDMLASQGLVWGVSEGVLPLAPGDAVTLTVGDDYYWPDPWSQVSWPLSEGTPVYAQVDSANAQTTYGAVLEMHEIFGGTYNNIASTVSALSVEGEAISSVGGKERPALPGSLPPRR